MAGKINIIFGFFFLALTAALGPAFLVPQLGAKGALMNETARAVADVKGAVESGAINEGLEAKQSRAITGLFDALKGQHIRGTGAHSHGNLEALLNIVAGFAILALAIPQSFKALLSLLFILGALFHSGMLYLGMVFGAGWAFKLLLVGEISLVAGLVLMGVAAAIGIRKPSQA